VKDLAERLNLEGFHPWASEEAMVNVILDHPCTGHASIAALRAEGGIRALNVSHVANPTLDFDTPSRKIEFYSVQAERLGLSPLPSYDAPASQKAATGSAGSVYSLALTQGRTLAHFHSFYNNGRELPTLARLEAEPALWMSSDDAAMRNVADGAAIRIFNARGDLHARARVTDRIPPGTVWMRDGWPNLNRLTAGAPVLPDAAVDLFAFSAGQASFDTMVEVTLA
jgi:anaerobic selenocysteine-containing dehydrogenase